MGGSFCAATWGSNESGKMREGEGEEEEEEEEDAGMMTMHHRLLLHRVLNDVPHPISSSLLLLLPPLPPTSISSPAHSSPAGSSPMSVTWQGRRPAWQ